MTSSSRAHEDWLIDCVAATSVEAHDNAIAKDYPMFSHPVTSKEFLASVAGTPERAETSRGRTT